MPENTKCYRIKGGNRLEGEIRLAGAKNALSKQLVASLLTDKPCIFTNVPRIGEVEKVLEMLSEIGSRIEWLDEHELKIQTPLVINPSISSKFQKYNRIPILLIGPLLHRVVRPVVVPIPGGCRIGSRPVDFHINALESMGAKISSDDFNYEAVANNGLHGIYVTLPYPSVGATESIILSAVLAQGKTVITNAAIEPEIWDTVCFLIKMGADISCRGTREIVINGVRRLDGATHHTISDRIEAASYAILALATDGYIKIQNAVWDHLRYFIGAFRQAGGDYKQDDGSITFFRSSGLKCLKPKTIRTDVHPGFMTDWQQPLTVALTQAFGTSIVHETVYENRFDYTHTLIEMGADIQLSPYCVGQKCRFFEKKFLHSAIINGPTPLRATTMTIPDLRAGFAHIIAALIAEGTSDIYGISQLERGYENVAGKLKSLGASIEVVNS